VDRARLHLVFSAAGLAAFLVATVGFDFLARAVVSNESVGLAASNSVRWLAEPLWTFLLLLPFLAAAILGAELSKAASARVGRAFFAVLLGVLGLLYFSGFWGAQTALVERKWTAATLSVGLTPFLSIPIIFVACIAAALIAWRHRKRET
jgi:hypothetical protein